MTTYEKVEELTDLRDNATVKVTTIAGDVLFGTIEFADNPEDGERYATYFRTSFGTMAAYVLENDRYTVETEADPTKGLPSGMFIHREACNLDYDIDKPVVLFHDGYGNWSYQGEVYSQKQAHQDAREWAAEGDLVRLLPEVLFDEILAMGQRFGLGERYENEIRQLFTDYS